MLDNLCSKRLNTIDTPDSKLRDRLRFEQSKEQEGSTTHSSCQRETGSLVDGEKREIKISVIFRPDMTVPKALDFGRRHRCMQADADEHYRILVRLQEKDPEFDKKLQLHYYRKLEVEQILSMSERWKYFSRSIRP